MTGETLAPESCVELPGPAFGGIGDPVRRASRRPSRPAARRVGQASAGRHGADLRMNIARGTRHSAAGDGEDSGIE